MTNMAYYDEVIELKKNKIINENTVDKNSNENIINNTKMNNQSISDIVKENKKATIAPIPNKISDKLQVQQKRPTSSMDRNNKHLKSERFESESSDSGSDTDSEENRKLFTDTIDPKQWETLNVPSEIKDIFQYILRYSPQKIDIDYHLEPFIPDYIPAVGDIDAFLNVVPPAPLNNENSVIVKEFIDKLGLEILDEPSGQQTDPILLHMKLRSLTTQPMRNNTSSSSLGGGGGGSGGGRTLTSSAGQPPPPSIVKNIKDIDKWINEIHNIHSNKPNAKIIHHKQQLQQQPDIDLLMTEWPSDMERILNNIGFPNASINCTLKFYIELVCTLFDIPIYDLNNQSDYLIALHTLFTLYMAIKQTN